MHTHIHTLSLFLRFVFLCSFWLLLLLSHSHKQTLLHMHNQTPLLPPSPPITWAGLCVLHRAGVWRVCWWLLHKSNGNTAAYKLGLMEGLVPTQINSSCSSVRNLKHVDKENAWWEKREWGRERKGGVKEMVEIKTKIESVKTTTVCDLPWHCSYLSWQKNFLQIR